MARFCRIFRLQRAAQPLHALETVLARGLLQFCERNDPQLFVELEDLVRPQARYGEHLKDSGRDFLAHRFKAGMCARAVKLRDDIGNGVADARNFREPILRDDLVQWHRKGADAVGRPGIGLGPVRIAAAQGRASGEFPEKLGDSRGVESSHTPNNAQRRDFAPVGGVRPPHRGSNLERAPHRLERAPLPVFLCLPADRRSRRILHFKSVLPPTGIRTLVM